MTGGGECNKKKYGTASNSPSEIPLSHNTQKEKRLPTLTSKQPRNQNIKKT
jgi:hypothetical protein